MSHYPVSGLLLRSYKCKYAFVPIFHSGPVRIERSGNSTLDIVIENKEGKPRIYPLDIEIKVDEILSYTVDPHNSKAVRFRLIPMIRDSQKEDLINRIKDHLH